MRFVLPGTPHPPRHLLSPLSDLDRTGLPRGGLNRLYQIMWQTNKVYNYAADNFEDRRQTATPLRDGWGLTKDNDHLIISDGSDTLTWLDPVTLQAVRSVRVRCPRPLLLFPHVRGRCCLCPSKEGEGEESG